MPIHTYNMPICTYNMLIHTYSMLIHTYNMLIPIYNMLIDTHNMLRHTYNMLIQTYNMLIHTYNNMLIHTYNMLINVHNYNMLKYYMLNVIHGDTWCVGKCTLCTCPHTRTHDMTSQWLRYACNRHTPDHLTLSCLEKYMTSRIYTMATIRVTMTTMAHRASAAWPPVKYDTVPS